MARARPGSLGKGLGALIPSTSTDSALVDVPVGSIGPNPRQPRGQFDRTQLEELAASLREHGVLQPLVVRRNDDGAEPDYLLIAGERRWRAARLAGLASVPAVVKEVDDRGLVELALVENIQRQDLNPLEEASAYRQLVSEFGLTQEDVAQRVGRSRVAVTNALRLLQAPRPVQEALARGEVTEGHARALLGAEGDNEQVALLRHVVGSGLSVRQTEELVRRSERHVAATPSAETTAHEPSWVEQQLEQALGTKVVVKRSRRGGTVTVYFYSEEELHGLLLRMGGDL